MQASGTEAVNTLSMLVVVVVFGLVIAKFALDQVGGKPRVQDRSGTADAGSWDWGADNHHGGAWGGHDGGSHGDGGSGGH